MPYETDNQHPGLIPVVSNDAEHVAPEVLKEQKGDEIWNLPEPATIEKLRYRLDEIRNECSQLWADLYPHHETMAVYKPPEYKRQADIRARLHDLEEEEGEINSFLRSVYSAYNGENSGKMVGPPPPSIIAIIGEDKAPFPVQKVG